jgi:hypothetical protein
MDRKAAEGTREQRIKMEAEFRARDKAGVAWKKYNALRVRASLIMIELLTSERGTDKRDVAVKKVLQFVEEHCADFKVPVAQRTEQPVSTGMAAGLNPAGDSSTNE